MESLLPSTLQQCLPTSSPTNCKESASLSSEEPLASVLQSPVCRRHLSLLYIFSNRPVLEGCLEFGASVIVASSSQTRVDEAIIRLRESGDVSRISGYMINLRRGTYGVGGIEARMSKFLLEQVKDPFDHIVFTAGDIFSVTDIGKADLDSVNRDMDVRYWAPFAACKILRNSRLLRDGGSITFTGGHIALRPEKGTAGAAGKL